MTDGQGPVPLDTHCWIWSQFGHAREFSATGQSTIRQAAADGILLVSIVSVWEVALLESKRRLQLNMDRLEWVRQALETPGLSLVPLTPEIAVDSTRLPGESHADPVDRILVATARNVGARLITRGSEAARIRPPASRAYRLRPIAPLSAQSPPASIKESIGKPRAPVRNAAYPTVSFPKRSYSALNSQPSSAMAATRYIHTSSAMLAPMLPYITL